MIIQPPVYHPFRLVPQRNKREVVYNPFLRTKMVHIQSLFSPIATVAAFRDGEEKPLKPQASFLVWLDCRALGLGHDGEMFNPGGQGFMRLNVAVPRSVLREAMERLRESIADQVVF